MIPSTTFIEALIGVLGRQGHQVLVIGKKKTTARSSHAGVSYFFLPTSRLLITLTACYYWLLFLICRPRQTRSVFKRIMSEGRSLRHFLTCSSRVLPVLWFNPDVFHVQWAKSLSKWIFLREFGIKIAVSLRGAHINYSPITDPVLAMEYKKCFPLVHGFHAVSEAIASEAAKYGAEPSKMKVVYSYVSNELIEFGRSQLRSRRPDWKGKPIKIISVGRYHWKKGYNYALDAMKILHDRGHDFRYTIIAGGEHEEYLYQVHDLDLTCKVSLRSEAPHSEVLKEVFQSDILLLPSVEEGIANVVLEAMTLGTLVVTSLSGGMGEVIRHGENGFLTKIRDPEDIADNILTVIQLSESERQCIADRAFQTILEHHTEEIFSRHISEFYDRLIA